MHDARTAFFANGSRERRSERYEIINQEGTNEMNLRKTIEVNHDVYRIFELAAGVFHVLDSEGHTVDEFALITSEDGSGVVTVKRDLLHPKPQAGAPDLTRRFASERHDTHLLRKLRASRSN